jgi:D-3-phosphoglycerate dehydrogenase
VRVLIADKFEQSGIDGLKAAGCEVLYQPDLKDEALTAAIRESAADVLVVRSTAVTAPMLESGALSLVVRAGAGYNTIDVATASKRGIYVSNCPGKNAIAVAELAFALLLAIDRRVPDNVAELRAGKWNKKEFSKARGLFGRTIGLLGYGNIGQEMARRAHAFGMPIVVWSRRFATGTGTRRGAAGPDAAGQLAAGRGGALRRAQRAPRAQPRHQRAWSMPRSSSD